MANEDHIPAIRYRLKNVSTYEIPVTDFNRIEEEGSAVGTHLQFATAWIPVAITLSLTLATVPIPSEKDRVYYTVLTVMLLSWALGTFHGVCAFRQRGRFKRLMDGLRELQVGPMGQEGEELKPTDLANLPRGPAGPNQLTIEEVPEIQTAPPQSDTEEAAN